MEIAEGGAAAMAYGRLQFEDLSGQNRKKIESALALAGCFCFYIP
jgi:hypothetical protein